MRSAIDTNIIVALWAREPIARQMATLLGEARAAGGLVICGPVHAEFHAHPRTTSAFVQTFLNDSGITVDSNFSEEAWHLIGAAYAAYAERRRQSAGGKAKRLLADFMIGAHSLFAADRLLTLDATKYQSAFPDLVLVGP